MTQPDSHRNWNRRGDTPLFGVPAIDGEKRRFPLDDEQLEETVRRALEEDEAFNDLTTTAVVVSDRRARGTVVAWGEGVVSGIPLAVEAFRLLDPKVAIRIDVSDGSQVKAGSSVLCISGHARAVLSAERVALNFLQHLSGIATLTAKYVEAVKGTRARILDTRKTIAGLRRLEKYAVRCGGGTNHRLDLSDLVLIKDNHLAVVGHDIALAVRRAREYTPAGTRVEVEVESLDAASIALEAGADVILLDNMDPEEMRECVEMVDGRVKLEASGGITLDSVRDVALTGVDYISIGALTHSAPALNMSLDFEAA